jgi:hypothetical protein
MILVQVADRDLLEAIEKKQKGWLARARKKKLAVSRLGKIGERDGIWSEVKEVFILLQRFKCIYCETPMAVVDPASADKVAVEYDVEHYRPKNRVTPWPAAADLARRSGNQVYLHRIGSGLPAGYAKLAFDPLNYVVSCKTCNCSYKLDRFPIAGQPESRARKRRSLDAKEKPLLLFPFGEHGDDPAFYLAFEGPMVGPRAAAGYEHLRGQVVIDFFELDTRAGLFQMRCVMLVLLWKYLEDRGSSDPRIRTVAEKFVRSVEEGHEQAHTACGRAFCELYGRNRALARELSIQADEFLVSKDPAVFRSSEGTTRTGNA